ncbi:Ankyrin repeat protein [Lasiodiplodia theobromae]|uniref:Ankyrin repeat protein n=1 Tax=Lasiodiplodia theobromae TaxID=45133 RepID=UPI0015C342F0|nr:Ankyrin repeat protein [Lasiodiplodia theobromae]KAF4537708.1 Ankyrin repeat protein [Lasiodiplodia theobromae]
MGLADLWSYAQLIFTAIGIIAVVHRFLLSNRDNVTELTTFQPPVEDETINIQQIESMYGDISATTGNGPRKKLRCGDYSIGIITALPNEMKAAKSVLDEEHEPPADFRKPDVDYNHYVWGSMSTQSEAAHNVVIASFPARKPGIVTAADVARLMVTTFPSIRLGLMVGIGGGVPTSNDIRLGDVVVSLGSGTTAGVVQYDFGDEEEEGFERKGQLNSPPAALLSAITALKACDSASSLIRTVIRASSKIQETDLNLDNEPTYTYQDVKIMRTDLQKISDKQIHDWLKPSDQQTNFDQAQNEIERYQTESTWFFEHEDYRDWSSHGIHHIWLHGQSGCGKTVLASTVVKQLSAEGKLCLYFFFDFRDLKKQSLDSLLRSLIWQLFSRSDYENVKTLVRQLYEDRNSPTPTIKKLRDMFDKMVEEEGEVQVVLDALDESTRKGTDRDELLRWLKPRTHKIS